MAKRKKREVSVRTAVCTYDYLNYKAQEEGYASGEVSAWVHALLRVREDYFKLLKKVKEAIR